MLMVELRYLVNPFPRNALFLYSLKTENRKGNMTSTKEPAIIWNVFKLGGIKVVLIVQKIRGSAIILRQSKSFLCFMHA